MGKFPTAFFCTCTGGYAVRREAEGVRLDEWNQLSATALGFPRGEAAERSEADEGWRQVGQ